MKFTIIIPTYNEAENIEPCINRLHEVVQKANLTDKVNYLVTDANSSDGTADIVRGLSRDNREVVLIEEKVKGGLGVAYSNAMQYAFSQMGSDGIITFDADLSHDPEMIPLMIQKIENGADYVCGTRYRKGGGIPENWALYRKFLSITGNLFVRILYFGSPISDFTSGFKAMRKEAFDKIGDKIGKHKGYTFSISTNLEAVRAGFIIEEVPYKFKDRTRGESKMGPEYILNGMVFVVKSRIRDFMSSRLFKVVVAGGVGAVAQLISYGLIFYPLIEARNVLDLPETAHIGGFYFVPQFFVSQLLAIEVGVLATFITNNFWAFGDHKLKGASAVVAFIKNNIVVSGAIVIQLFVGQILASIFGSGLISHYIYQVIGILVGLTWNFYFYKKFIWKIKN